MKIGKKKSLNNKLKPVSFEKVLNSDFFIGLAEKSRNVFWIRSGDYTKQLYISPAYEKIWGRTCQSLYDEPDQWVNYLHPDDKKRLENDLSQRDINLISVPQRYDEEYRIVRPDGQIRWIKDHGFPIYDTKGIFIGFAGIAEDVTNDKVYEQALIAAKEKAEAANKAKTEFLQNMRHDMRTPLSGIMGFARLVKDEAQNSRMEEYADNMFASSKALLDFVNEILETINITSGELPLLKKKFDVYQKLESIISLLRSKANAKNINLTFHLDEELPRYLVGDYKRLSRIALEIIANALNFTHEGSVNVSLELAQLNEFKAVLKLVVKDTGIGIPEDKKEDIFLRFSRLTPSYEGIYKGAGLGLTITKQFIDDLHGEIQVESIINQGSTFNVLVPMDIALLANDSGIDKTQDTMIFSRLDNISIPKKENTIISENPSKQTQINSHILIVEDDHIAAVSTKKMLEKLNCHVDVASTGKAAIELAQRSHFDLIFMDIGLPDIRGHEVTQEIRAWEAGHEDKHTPIIALTAHISTEEKQGFIEAGMDAALAKPLLKETALDILKTFIPGHTEKKIAIKKEEKEKKTSFTKKKVLFDLKGNILDHKDMLKKYGNEETVKEIYRLLQESFDEEIPKIKNAIKKKDWETVKKISHKFRGSASYCGTERFQQSCAHLEDYLKTGADELREKLLDQLFSEIELVKEAIS